MLIVIGDTITDAIAGFFEGHISEWLRYRGIQESREAVTTGLGKMAGCLSGYGLVLTIALLFGINISYLNCLRSYVTGKHIIILKKG